MLVIQYSAFITALISLIIITELTEWLDRIILLDWSFCVTQT